MSWPLRESWERHTSRPRKPCTQLVKEIESCDTVQVTPLPSSPSQTAFFDPSILELLYFPDDQKWVHEINNSELFCDLSGHNIYHLLQFSIIICNIHFADLLSTYPCSCQLVCQYCSVPLLLWSGWQLNSSPGVLSVGKLVSVRKHQIVQVTINRFTLSIQAKAIVLTTAE